MTVAALPPGPRAPGLLQAVSWGLRYPQFTSAAHRRHGTTFTVRPGTMGPVVVTTDDEAIRLLLTGDPLRRGHGNDAVRPLIGDRAVLLLEPAEHLERRRLLLPAFHGERVQAYARLMQQLMDAEVGRWSPGVRVAVLPAAQNVTIEVILQAVLGVADEPLRRRFRQLIDRLLFYPFGSSGPPPLGAAVFTPAVATYFPGLKRRSWKNPMTLGWWRHRDRLVALLDEHIKATRADPRLGEREDVLAMLVQALPDEDLPDELITLIGAGHETTAAGIAWGAVLLAHHPHVRTRAEAAARDGDEEYLDALVKEVLRVRPPLPVAAGGRLDEPARIAGHVVPAGTPILIDAWGIHHDPARHADPEAFRPERFLGDAAEAYAWLPFGGGAHRCIGAGLAELEMKIGLATLLRRVALRPAGPRLPRAMRRGVVIVPEGGGPVQTA